MSKETSADVAAIAGRLLNLDIGTDAELIAAVREAIEADTDVTPLSMARRILWMLKARLEPDIHSVAASALAQREEELQPRVLPWLLECFGPEIASDKVERNHRFLEEALELVQSCGCQKSEAHELVDYVYGRPQGEINQEVGGVMITLAALCLANGFDMHKAGETELARIWTKVDQIRRKQATKPRNSPVPEPPAPPQPKQEANES